MQDEVVNSASFSGDVDPILPDGWGEGVDLFAESETGTDPAPADGQETDLLAGLENDDATALEALLTTDGEDKAGEPDAGAQTPQTPPDGEAKPAERAPRKLTLKVNHEEQEVDIDAMSDDELRALLQKGKAFDAMKDAENKRTYRQVYQEQVDAGMTEAAARMIARDAANGNTYALTDEEEAEQSKVTVAPPAPDAMPPSVDRPQTRDLRTEVEQLRALYPEIKEMPDEVAKAVSKGIPLLTAYLAYREQQSAKAAANLRKENRILKQNAANTAKAPVRGVTGGDSSAPKSKSIFEAGFDAGFNWT